jgi:hypothetical protein
MYGHQSHIYGIATSTYAAYASILQPPLLLAYVRLQQPARAPHTANAQPLMRVPIQPITQPHRLRLTPSPAPNAIPSTQDNTHPPARAPTQLTYVRSNHTQQHTQEYTRNQPVHPPASQPARAHYASAHPLIFYLKVPADYHTHESQTTQPRRRLR